MVSISVSCVPYGHYSTMLQNFQNFLRQENANHGQKIRICFYRIIFEKGKWSKSTIQLLVINPQGEMVNRTAKCFPFYPYAEVGVNGRKWNFASLMYQNVGRLEYPYCFDIGFQRYSEPLPVMRLPRVVPSPQLYRNYWSRHRAIDSSKPWASCSINATYFDVNGYGYRR